MTPKQKKRAMKGLDQRIKNISKKYEKERWIKYSSSYIFNLENEE
jgi:hypothetical protein